MTEQLKNSSFWGWRDRPLSHSPPLPLPPSPLQVSEERPILSNGMTSRRLGVRYLAVCKNINLRTSHKLTGENVKFV
jgi:hypothetical protein